MRAIRSAVLSLAAIALLAACGSSSSSSESTASASAPGGLNTSASVVEALASAGIPCHEDGSEPAIDTSTAAQGTEYITCESFAIMVIVDRDLYAAQNNCEGTEQLDWSAADMQHVVVGPNFVVIPVGDGTQPIPEFAENASAFDFVQGLGGTELSATDWMTQEGCVRPSK